MAVVTAKSIKASVVAYWRFNRQCPVVTLEDSYGARDIVVVTPKRYLVEIEVKVSISDLRREQKKPKHRLGMGPYSSRNFISQFYFAVPKELANKAALLCGQLFPYAGVIGTNGLGDSDTQIYREARILSTKKLPIMEVTRLVKSQSGTVCHLARDVGELERINQNLAKQLDEVREKLHILEGML